ncbi:MAG: MetQ/NlpA family ABC transporter substrate-binding protein [Negativibacillus massiliensis]|uniref:MetQ/NlpA family ABC transporter substrate-binding protein n=1 Tax=Negativibacillus massiliensis TaxID=1871035 RepID=UPI00033B4272|nr:MetQ/NlpA family ABC transporter substrate-binding protein [Negativibacillus massiliensis]MBS5137041.1 MetQ/NlpA family ABC transporter substrate-binding protein [Clostridium sp.]MCI6346709.1 MetQ/NlpA family ABC transporter substrate-binding protein [Negativibacillus massiliensis]MDY4047444.1 MetQ/NlpA family ABC transporter substrate-binding protein [Negativibacillus massiliensis]CDA78091.1 lipoprotein [Clostridium sp. CAG:242]
MKLRKFVVSFLACSIALSLAVGLTGCGAQKQGPVKEGSIVVGASPSPHAQILEAVSEQLAQKGYQLEIKEFTDYIMPNTALEDGELDANFFQHQPYLTDFNEKNGTKLVSAAAIHFEPLGIYGGKTADLADLPEGAQIAVPNDTTNEARALWLLQAQGIIEVDEQAGLEATKQDITSNPKNVEIVEMEAAQLPRALADVDFAVINGNYAVAAEIADQVLVTEDKDSEAAKQYANIVAVREGDENREDIKALVEALQSDEVKAYIEETFGSTVIPVF